MVITGGGATLTGGGVLTLGDNSQNYVEGATAATTLTNMNNTISGGGHLGNGQLTLVNQASGVINASAANNALVLNTGSATIANAGLIEATGAAGLTLQGATINDASGGVIQAAGGNVSLFSTDIIGGTLKSSGANVITTTDRGSLIDGTGSHAVTNLATIAVANNTTLSLQGAITNRAGHAITLNSAGNLTDLLINTSGVTLSGGGVVTLTDNSQNYLIGAAAGAMLNDVDNTISGAGQLGGGMMRLVLGKTAVVNANGANNALVLNTAGQWLTNGGLIEATGAAGLNINSTTVNNAFGVIQAIGSTVRLASDDIIGGTLKTASGGVITTTDRGTLIDATGAHPLNNQANLVVANNTSLSIQGTISSNSGGGVSLASAGNATYLQVTALNATLSTGAVQLSDNTQNYIVGTLSGASGAQTVSTLTSNGVIAGAGNLGANLHLVNNSVIDATLVNGLAIKTGNAAVAGSNVITNNGLLESTNPNALSAVGGLILSNVTVANNAATGIVEANGLHTHVNLHSTTIAGGALVTQGGGAIYTLDRGNLFDGTGSGNPLNNQAAVKIVNNTSLSLQGAINNTGAISLLSAGNITELKTTALNTTLSGAGAVTLSDNSQNYIYGATAGSTLTNVNNTISGAGQLGSGQLTLVNQALGVINANGASNALVLNTGTSVVTNAGLIEATGAGGLNINGTTVNNGTTGVIQAVGSVVRLSSADLIGGALKTSSGGHFDTQDRGSLFDGATNAVNLASTVNVLNNTSLNLQGAIHNSGVINLNSGGNITALTVTAGNAVLSYGGKVILSDNSQNYINAASAGAKLTNYSDTISGAGQIGGGLVLVNSAGGVINATGVNNALVFNTGTSAVTNAGLIETTAAGGLNINSSTINNGTTGVIQAVGSVVRLSTADLIGGTLKTTNGGHVDILDRGSLLDGTASTFNLASTVNILNNTSLYLQGTINNTGSINLQSAGNVTELVVTANNATLTGGGTVVMSDNSQTYVYGASAAAKLTLANGAISGAGQLGNGQLTLAIGASGVVNATGASNALVLNTGANAIVNAGLIEATGSGGLVVDSAVTNTGLLEANGGVLNLTQAVSGAGSAIIASGTLQLGAAFSENVKFTGASGVLDLAQSQAYTGSVSGLSHAGGTLIDLRDISFGGGTKATYSGTTAGGTLTVTDGAHTAHITLVGDYTTASFVVASDGHSGTLVHDPVAAALAPTTEHATQIDLSEPAVVHQSLAESLASHLAAADLADLSLAHHGLAGLHMHATALI